MEFSQRALFRRNGRDDDRLRQADARNLLRQIVVHFLFVSWHPLFRYSDLHFIG
jgi:hypothetical protein